MNYNFKQSYVSELQVGSGSGRSLRNISGRIWTQNAELMNKRSPFLLFQWVAA